MSYTSETFSQVVEQLTMLPSVGEKTAMRFIFHLLQQDKEKVHKLAYSLLDLINKVRGCQICGYLTDQNICSICTNTDRNTRQLCVVEGPRDVMALEKTQVYKGLYHVSGGLIAPLHGISPEQLNLQSLVNRLQEEEIDELIFALSPNIQGDTTIFYICRQISSFYQGKIMAISRGVSFGGSLEYADERTLSQAVMCRQAVEHYVKS